MKQCTTFGNYGRLEGLVNTCATLPDFQYGIGKQAYIYQKGVVILRKDKNSPQALRLFDEALNTFSLRDEDGNETLRIFTIEEVGINVDKAARLYKMGHKQQALDLLQSNINDRLDNYENVETYQILRSYFYLAQFYLQDKNYEQSIKVATEGIKLSNYKFVYI